MRFLKKRLDKSKRSYTMIYRTELYGIIGAGGFGREVMPVARQMIADAYGSKGHELVVSYSAPPSDSKNWDATLRRSNSGIILQHHTADSNMNAAKDGV